VPKGLDVSKLRDLLSSLTFQVLAIAVASRIVLAFANWFSLRILPRLPFYDGQRADWFLPQTPLLDGWARWDSAHYINVALNGYGLDDPEQMGQRVAFFPLYPMLIRAVATVTGAEESNAGYAIAAIVAANLCFFAAVPLFARLVARLASSDVARVATTLLCISPLAFFFNAAYTESLFLLLSIGAFTFAYEKKWLPASACIALASGTRLFGLALIPAILLIAYRERASLRDMAMICLVSPLGTVAFFGWLWREYGDPMTYFNAQANWGGWDDRVGNYLDVLLDRPGQMLASPMNTMILINVGLAIVCLIALYWVWKLLEPGMALYTTIIVVFHLVYTWNSLGYLLPALGVYIVAGMLLARPGWNSWVRESAYICSAIILTTLTVLFAHGFWIV
jgi:Gpi18-like mannosyltransferase